MTDTNLTGALDEPTFTVGEFAKAVGVKPVTVYRWMKRGLVTYATTPTGRIKIPQSEVAACMTVHAPAKPTDLESGALTAA
jgi:predicted site-specific integrase-resolvase